MNDTISLLRPDDWHLHVRQGTILNTVVPHTARSFGRALIMPNLVPPVADVPQAEAYRQEILNAATGHAGFDPVMTLYLTDNTSAEVVKRAADSTHVCGFKLYPAGATTNSDSGVTSIFKVMDVLESMAEHGLVLQVHGEVTDPHIDIFDREKTFIDQVLLPLRSELPALRIVFEHITTRDAAQFVSENENIGATITPQHLMYSRNDIFEGGIRPHYYCLPILKRQEHRLALLAAATGGDHRFFLGTDSAPHARGLKESACGCAGIYSAGAAIELYAEIFEAMDALSMLEPFASHYGADFYRVPRNTDQIRLKREDWTMPDAFPVANQSADGESLVPMRAGQNMRWRVVPT